MTYSSNLPQNCRKSCLFRHKGDGTMKVAIYCRLSEEDRNKVNKDDDSNSIKNQKAMLIQYAVSQEWDVYDIYSDDDYDFSW